MGQGEAISFSLFFKTTNAEEMILLAYANNFSPFFKNDLGFIETDDAAERVSSSGDDDLPKDLLLLTLNDGKPYLYTSHKRYLIPTNFQDDERLNDGQWHHIAISMPSKSCLLSQVKLYINGSLTLISVIGDDIPIFFYTSGSLSLGGWGYSNIDHETLFPNVTNYKGAIDEFFLWGRSVSYNDLKPATLKKFKRNKNVACALPNDSRKLVGRMGAKKCRKRCRRIPNCWGYESKPEAGKLECYIYSKRPELGEAKNRAQCNPAV